MDMRQAAEYFKTRWQWREEAASVRERHAKEFEDQRAAVAARKAAAKMAAEGDVAPPTPKPGPKPRREPSTEPVQKSVSRKSRMESEQQKILATYVNSVVEMLEYTSPVGTSRDAETAAALSAALSLLDKSVSPEQLLELSKKVKAATGSDQREEFLASNNLSSQQVSYWRLIEDEVKNLEAMQGKGDKLEWSSKFASDSVSIIEAFLGPAGPMFRTARDLYKEYKESFKNIKERWTRMSEWMAAKKSTLGKHWATARLKSGLLFGKLNDMFSGLGGFGAKLMRGAAGAIGKFAKPLLLLAGGLAAAIAAFTFKDQIGDDAKGAADWVGEKYRGIKTRVRETGKKLMDGVKSFIDRSPVLSRVKGLVSKTADGITNLHSQAVDWVSQKSSNLASMLTNKYVETMDEYEELKSSFADVLGSVSNDTSGVFDKLTGFFEEVWSRIKKYVPNWLRRAYNKAKAVVSSPEKSVKAGAAISTSDPAGGDGVAKPPSGGAATAADSVKQPSGKVNTGSVRGVSLAGVNPTVQQNFLAMTTEFEQLTGRKVQVNSGKRSTADQERLYRTMPGKAARPGYSMHEFGLAIDANSAEVNKMASMGLMQKYGFATPVPGEPWHIEPVSIQKYKKQIRAAKDGEDADKAIAAAVGSPTGGADTEMAASEPGGSDSVMQTSEAVKTAADGAKGREAEAKTQVYPQMAKNQANMLAPKPEASTLSAKTEAGDADKADPGASMSRQVMQAAGSMGLGSLADPSVSMAKQVMQAAGSMGLGSLADPSVSMAKQVMQAASDLGPSKDMGGDLTDRIMSALDQVKSGAKSGAKPGATYAEVASLSEPTPARPSFTKTSASVAPAADGEYKQVASKAKGARMADVPEEKEESAGFAGGSNVQTSSNSISLWLGDPGMLTLNLGIGA